MSKIKTSILVSLFASSAFVSACNKPAADAPIVASNPVVELNEADLPKTDAPPTMDEADAAIDRAKEEMKDEAQEVVAPVEEEVKEVVAPVQDIAADSVEEVKEEIVEAPPVEPPTNEAPVEAPTAEK